MIATPTMLLMLSYYLPVTTVKLIPIPAGFAINFAEWHFIVFTTRRLEVKQTLQQQSSAVKDTNQRFYLTVGGRVYLENLGDVIYGLVA